MRCGCQNPGKLPAWSLAGQILGPVIKRVRNTTLNEVNFKMTLKMWHLGVR